MNSTRVIGLGLIALVIAAPAWAATKGPVPLKSPKNFPIVISRSGSYQLIGNLAVPTAAPAIQIEASNVTLDLNGFTVQGNDATSLNGIIATNTDLRNITIENGVVHGFAINGVNLAGSGHVVLDVRAEGNGVNGVHVSVGSLVERCTATGNGAAGIAADTACAIQNNVCTGNGTYGINAGQLCTVLHNTCNQNGQNGIRTDQGSTVSQNNCSGNSNPGIQCIGSNNSIVGNTCVLNNTAGIDLGSANGNYAAENKLSGNSTPIINAGGDTLGTGDLANVTF